MRKIESKVEEANGVAVSGWFTYKLALDIMNLKYYFILNVCQWTAIT